MYCPQCGTANPPEAHQCQKCAAPLPRTEATVGAGAGATLDSAGDATVGTASFTPPTGTGGTGGFGATLEPGRVLGNRYEIVSVLGQGGMGAVYKVRDREVGGYAALKVIRPEMASRPEVLQRFKQELILARQVTHKNVIRIHDLGEAEGIKFITMDFVEGRDLSSLIHERGKFPPEEAVKVIAQVSRALEAAHAEGVVHRDLKPQNIMLDAQGRVKVMDFGIARSTEMTGGMTQTGALLGTPEYMSPEQAKGQEVDARSDLFSLGIIFYEMLTGKTPFHADTILATIFRRTQETARPPLELDPAIPQQINDVVVKCLTTERDQRFQSAGEILVALGQQAATASTISFPRSAAPSTSATTGAVTAPAPAGAGLLAGRRKWLAAGAAVLVVAVAVAAFVFRGRLLPGGSTGKGTADHPLSLAILPFRNASGDASLNWLGASLSEMLRTDIGQSKSFRTVPTDRVEQLLHDLRLGPDSELDSATLSRVADFTSADEVLGGQFVKIGDQIRIDATLHDIKNQRSISLKADAASEKNLLHAVDELARSIRQNLALPSDVLKELRASSFRPSSKSVQALRDYQEGIEFVRQGNEPEALKSFQAATNEDSSFALAYSQLGQAYAALGYDGKAANFSQKAVDLSDRLPPQERYLISANQALVLGNKAKAIQAYENLAKVSPDDSDIEFTLARLYEGANRFDRARHELTELLAHDPKHVGALFELGRVEVLTNNAQGSLDYLNRALSLAIQLGDDSARANILRELGVAYRLLARPDAALRNDRDALAISRRVGDKGGTALSLVEIARVQQSQAKPDAALKSYQEALQIQREIGDKAGTADTLSDLGRLAHGRGEYDQAQKFDKQSLQIWRDLNDPLHEALCLNNIGNVYDDMGRYGDALTYLQQALQLRESLKIPEQIAETTYNLAYTYSLMGQYDQAIDGYLRALNLWRNAGAKRNAAIASHGLGTVYGYQGRYGAALAAKADALKTLRELNVHGYWLAAILSSYGDELSQVGRFHEAQKALDEAMREAREAQSKPMIAQTLDFQGERLFYLGQFQAARPLFNQSLQSASQAGDRQKVLLARMGLAKLDVEEGRSSQAIAALRKLVRESDTLGLKYTSVEGSLYIGEALLQGKDYAGAQRQLEAVVLQSQQLGFRVLVAKAQYLLGTALHFEGRQAQAKADIAQARSVLSAIRKETGTESIVKRSDLRPIVSR